MIVTRHISIGKLLRFTRLNLGLLLFFIALALLAVDRVPGELLRALSYASGFLGTALAFLIGFRNNSAYGRWWEAQRVWSRLKYDSRSFASHVLALLPGAGAALQRQLLQRQIAFAWQLNRQLRGLSADAELQPLIPEAERKEVAGGVNPALALLSLQSRDITAQKAAGHLDSYQHIRMLSLLQNFQEVLGHCERLKKTPFPMQYTWFMNYSLVVFLLILPLSLAGHLGYWSLPFSLLIGYAFVMLEYVGRHIETPFENSVNDVPMDYIARTVEIDLRQMLGDSELPPAIKPRGKGYLY